MTRSEVKEMCGRMGVYFDESHPDHISVNEISVLEPPFLEYTLTDISVNADGIQYLVIKRLVISLYSDTEESAAESCIETVLLNEELRWRKTREFDEELLLWVITYTLEV